VLAGVPVLSSISSFCSAVVFLTVSSSLSIIPAFVVNFVCAFVLVFVLRYRRSVPTFVVHIRSTAKHYGRVGLFSAVGLWVLHLLCARSCV
jgi:hypothetical protein